MTELRWRFLGRVGYRAAVELQESLRRRILDGENDAEALLLVEHDPVITLGRGARAEHVLATDEELAHAGMERVASGRGGDVTYHGPGQLVAYPVMRLGRGVVAHVEALAAAAVTVARQFSVEASFRRDCPGVWVGESKLAAIGVHVHRRVAIHGLALNVCTDLAAFSHIVPCGLAGARVTSLSAEAGRAIALAEAVEPFAVAFAAALARRPVGASSCFPSVHP